MFRHNNHWVSVIEPMTKNHRTGETIHFAVQIMNHMTRNEEIHCFSLFSGTVEARFKINDCNIKAAFIQRQPDGQMPLLQAVLIGENTYDIYFHVPQESCAMPGSEPALLYCKLEP